MCNNASNASPHRSEHGPVGVLQSWNGDAGIKAGYCGSIAYGNVQTRCSHVSALQTTFAVNTPIISDSLRLSHEMWAHLEPESEELTCWTPDVGEE